MEDEQMNYKKLTLLAVILCVVMYQIFSAEIMVTYDYHAEYDKQLGANEIPIFISLGGYDFRFLNQNAMNDITYIYLNDTQPPAGDTFAYSYIRVMNTVQLHVRKSNECDWTKVTAQWPTCLDSYDFRDATEAPEEGKIYTYKFDNRTIQIYIDRIKYVKGWIRNKTDNGYSPAERVKYITVKIIVN